MADLKELMKAKNAPAGAVDLEALAEKVLQQQTASIKVKKIPLHYISITRSRAGFMLGNDIIRPDVHGMFFPKNEAEKAAFESRVEAGLFTKVGE